MSRISESDLILPALYILNKEPVGYINTTNLIKKLTVIMRPTGDDAKILAGRKDTYFSQIVRNLKSHDTLEKKGYATYTKGQGYKLTSEGKKLVEVEKASIEYLISSGFRYDDVVESFNQITTNIGVKKEPYEEIIIEGGSYIQMTKYTQRSRKLRDAAIKYFTELDDGNIICKCCGFDFSYYSPKYSCNCIEIHHIKPLFKYEDIDERKTIEEALINLLPVCPNCHRVIHKCNIDANEIVEFKCFLDNKSI